MTEICHTVEDFQRFFHDHPNNVLDIAVTNVIKELEIIISSVNNSENTINKPKQYAGAGNKNYVEKRRHFDKDKKMQKEITTDDWQEIRNFKTTKIEVKEGFDKQVNNIRVLLNKISNKNYDSYKQNIFNEMQAYFSSEDTEENKQKIIKIVFDIASTNKFYSEIYADLYKELTVLFPFFAGDILENFLEEFREGIHKINYVDPNTDYDGFCNYTKINDNRKATGTFIINLMKKEILTTGRVLQLLVYIQQLLFEYIDQPDRANEVQEITENIFIFVTLGYPAYIDNPLWQDIYDKIVAFTKMSVKEHNSLSNRAIFKHLDILDSMKKAEAK